MTFVHIFNEIISVNNTIINTFDKVNLINVVRLFLIKPIEVKTIASILLIFCATFSVAKSLMFVEIDSPEMSSENYFTFFKMAIKKKSDKEFLCKCISLIGIFL